MSRITLLLLSAKDFSGLGLMLRLRSISLGIIIAPHVVFFRHFAL